MKVSVIILLLAAIPAVHATEAATVSTAAVSIGVINGVAMEVRPTAFSRIVPFAYYDQGMESIPAMHPGAVILADQREGFAGKVMYSLIAFKTKKDSVDVEIGGMAAADTGTNSWRAWYFHSKCNQKDLGNVLIRIVEHLSRLPFTAHYVRSHREKH